MMGAWSLVGGSRFIAASMLAGLLTGSALGAVWLVVDSAAGDRATRAFAELAAPARAAARITAATPSVVGDAVAAPVRSLEALLPPETPLSAATALYLDGLHAAEAAARADATASARARSVGDTLRRAVDHLAETARAEARRFDVAQRLDRARLADWAAGRPLALPVGADAATLAEAAERTGANRSAAAARAIAMERIAALLSVLGESETAAERDAVRLDLRRAVGQVALMPRFDLVAAVETFAAALDRVDRARAVRTATRTALADAGAGLVAALDGVTPGSAPALRRAGISQDAGVAALILLSAAAGIGWAAWTLSGRRSTDTGMAAAGTTVRFDREPLLDALARRTAPADPDRVPEPHRLLAALETVDWPTPGSDAAPRPAPGTARLQPPDDSAADPNARSARAASDLAARAVRTATKDLESAVTALLARRTPDQSSESLHEAVAILTDATRQIGDLASARSRTLDVRRLIGRAP